MKRSLLVIAVCFFLAHAGATAAQAGNVAQFVSQTAPSSMTTGQTVTVTVAMANTGTTTWSMAGGYKLGSQNPQDNATWGPTSGRVYLSAADSIPPGQEKIFSFSITAPATPGSYNFQWRMVQEGVEWFGALTPNLVIAVTAPISGDSSQFVSQSVPATLDTGQVRAVSVTMTNNGSTTWTPGLQYRLGAQNPQDNVTWGVGRVSLPNGTSVAPGQQFAFSFNVTAPATAGTYNFQWKMLREGVAWFGALSPNVAIQVVQTATICPGVQAVLDGLTDVSGALQQCVNNTPSSGTLQIPAGNYGMGGVVTVSKPMTLRTAGTTGSSQSCAGAISCAVLIARPDLFVFGGFVFLNNTTDVTLDHLVFDGHRSARLGSSAAGQCSTGGTRYGYNVRVDHCISCNFTNNVDRNTLCGSSLEWVGDNATITGNLFLANGDHQTTGLWSDGLTLLQSNGASVTDNTFTDNSDVALILGGSTSANVLRNSIVQSGQGAFAGFSLDDFSGTATGDFTGTLVSQNTISCGASHLCDFGMNFGPRAWDMTAPNIKGGTVTGNTVTSAKQGINVAGAGTAASPLLLYGNSSSGSPAAAQFNCGQRSTSNLNISTTDSAVNRNGDMTFATNVPWNDCP